MAHKNKRGLRVETNKKNRKRNPTKKTPMKKKKY